MGQVALPHGELDAFQGAVFREGLEIPFRHLGGVFPGQLQHFRPGLESRLAPRRGVSVVGAGGLAEVTARQVAVEGGPLRQGGAVLQGEVADAFDGIQEAGFLEGPGGAGVQAGGAGLTKIIHRFVEGQFHIRKGDAIKWTIALENSNLFKVKKGDYSNRKPSLFVYNQKATCTDWEGFYRGLMRSVQESNQTEKELDRYLNNDEWAAIVKRNVEAQTTAVIDEIGGGRGPAMQEFA